MNHYYGLTRRACVLGLTLAAGTFLRAQSADVDADDDIIELSPFEVTGSRDTGYRASETLAGNRLRTSLRDVGSAVSVLNDEFLQDTGSTNAEQLLVYAANTEVSGQGGSFLGQGDGAILDSTSRQSPVANTRVRGLSEADNTRDFFLTDIPWDSYVVNRIDLQRGANSVLFGIGSPAGIINATTQTAEFFDAGEAEARIGSYGSYRFSLNYNKEILENELAVRVAGLYDDTKYRQDPAFREDKRIYGAIRYEPSFLNSGSARTRFRANFEDGEIDENRPRLTPPMDALTPWWTDLGQQTYNARYANDSTATDEYALAGFRSTGTANYEPWLGAAGNRIWDGVVVPFLDHTQSGSQGQPSIAQARNWPNPDATPPAQAGGTYSGIVLYNTYSQNSRLPYFNTLAPYKPKSLTDDSVFDFYDQLLEGPNKSEFTEFTAYNLALAQTFADDSFGFEIAYDNQDVTFGGLNYVAGDAAAITVDVQSHLVDGSPNPNAGRAMIISGGGSAGGYQTARERETFRITAFADVDFREVLENETVGKILGRHVFTGLWSELTINNDSRSWARFFLADEFSPNANRAVGEASRDAVFVNYISGDLSGASSPAGLHLPNLKVRQQPSNGNINVWNNETNAWQTIPLTIWNNDVLPDDQKRYTNRNLYEEVTGSKALIWQAYMFDGLVVPMIGWREDTDTNKNAGNYLEGPRESDPANTWLGQIRDLNDPENYIPQSAAEAGGPTNRSFSKERGESLTYSIVVKSPQSLNDRLPWGTNFTAFYSQSENFQPLAGRSNVLGEQIASPNGETKDYGFTISTLEDKLQLKVNWYESSVAGATLNGNGFQNQYLIGAGEAWGQQAAVKLVEGRYRSESDWDNNAWPGDAWTYTNGNGVNVPLVTSDGFVLHWQPAGDPNYDATVPYTQQAIDAQYAIERAAVDAWLANPVSAQFQSAWGMSGYAEGSGSWSQNNTVITGTTISEGIEFEITANPIPGLTIAFNASKTSAKRTDLAKEYVDWISQRWELYQGPAGDMRIWGNGNWAVDPGAGGSTRSKFLLEVMSEFGLQTALENSDVPELRKWRWNAVVNYTFQGEKLRGLNVGASYRWLGKNTIGFPIIQNAEGDDTYDIANPYSGPSESFVDFWVGYERPLTDSIDWRVQLNVRNAFGGDDLIPVTAQPDGTPAVYRIAEPMTWYLSNVFTF